MNIYHVTKLFDLLSSRQKIRPTHNANDGTKRWFNGITWSHGALYLHFSERHVTELLISDLRHQLLMANNRQLGLHT